LGSAIEGPNTMARGLALLIALKAFADAVALFARGAII
jgi:hypothetical protein